MPPQAKSLHSGDVMFDELMVLKPYGSGNIQPRHSLIPPTTRRNRRGETHDASSW